MDATKKEYNLNIFYAGYLVRWCAKLLKYLNNTLCCEYLFEYAEKNYYCVGYLQIITTFAIVWIAHFCNFEHKQTPNNFIYEKF